ncbi:hypothetical protein [Rhizobium giardinii]|uniref:hypothetical protein n=1 Tax=Rhizobium giardinii TaxID=56731 RepID=UPI003D701B6E
MDIHEYVYLLKTAAGTRIIGGTTSLLSASDQFVIYHSAFPRIAVSFAPVAQGICSHIIRRKKTWQSTLPVSKLKIPAGLMFDASDTRQMSSRDGGGRVTFDLAPLARGIGKRQLARQPRRSEVDAAFNRAKELIYKIGDLFTLFPGLEERVADELGIRIALDHDE